MKNDIWYDKFKGDDTLSVVKQFFSLSNIDMLKLISSNAVVIHCVWRGWMEWGINNVRKRAFQEESNVSYVLHCCRL